MSTLRQCLLGNVLWMGLAMTSVVFAVPRLMSLDLQRADLPDAVRLMAKFLHMSVMVSPAVQGVVTLHLQDVSPQAAFDLLLASQGLAKHQFEHIWYVAAQEEIAKQQEVAEKTQRLETWVLRLKYGKAVEMAKLLQGNQATLISKRGSVRVDERTNTICVQDLPRYLAEVKRLLATLDVPVEQLLIEVRLVSIDSDYERELGLHFALGSATRADEMGRYGLALAKLADGSLLDVKLAALESAGHAHLISSPSLFTANQQPASIEAGEEIPYQETSESGGTAVVFKKAVLGLKVTPQVLPNDNVLLHMQLNQDRPSNKMVQGVPTISTRQIVSNVLIKSRQTIVLGGIYETDHENGQQRVPFVSRIPLVGLLFTETHVRKNRRELLIFVTARVMTPHL